jgi:hypothetical protein
MTPATPTELFQLAEIRLRESSNDYGAPPKNPPYATASGAYQFIQATWKQAWAAVAVFNVTLPPLFAYLATPTEQDACALWLLRTYGANSSHAWKASGPYPSAAEITFALQEIGVAVGSGT